MFPIRDHNPSGRTPFATYALILVNVGVFLGYWLTLPDDRALVAFFMEYGIVPRRVMLGSGLNSLFTSMFLHGGVMHLAGNMLFLWIFGDNLEDLMGHGRFLGFYLLSGLAAAVLQVGADMNSVVPVVGASGAIAGVMGGYLLLFPRAKVDVLIIFVIFFRIFPVPAWLMLGLWFAMQLFNGLTITDDGVAYWAHLGGFAAGLGMALPLWWARGGTAFWAATHGVPQHPEAKYTVSRSRIPRVTRRK